MRTIIVKKVKFLQLLNKCVSCVVDNGIYYVDILELREQEILHQYVNNTHCMFFSLSQVIHLKYKQSLIRSRFFSNCDTISVTRDILVFLQTVFMDQKFNLFFIQLLRTFFLSGDVEHIVISYINSSLMLMFYTSECILALESESD